MPAADVTNNALNRVLMTSSQVNGKFLSKDSHDDVAGTIREGCRVSFNRSPAASASATDDSVDSHSGDTESSETEESEVRTRVHTCAVVT